MRQVTEKRALRILAHEYVSKESIAIIASGAVIGILYVLAQNHGYYLYLLSNGLPPLLAFAAFGTATAALVQNGIRIKHRLFTVSLGYSLGMLLWFLGESTWGVYALWYSVPFPFPSIADVFWLVGYVPLASAMLILAWPFRDFFSSKRMLATVFLVIVLACSLLALLIPPTYSSEVGDTLVGVVVSLAYPLLDVGLLAIALPLLLLFRKGIFWRPFLFITIGLTLAFIGDILFSWATLTGVYYDGSYLELFFHWSYLTLALGYYLRFKSRKGRRAQESI